MQILSHSNDKEPLHVMFKTIAHIYDSDDPSPGASRELTERAEEVICSAVLDTRKPLQAAGDYLLDIRIPAPDYTFQRETDISSAIRAFFLKRADEIHRERRLSGRVGLREFQLTIAVCVPALLGIVACDPFPHEPLAIILQNVLLIFCWVVIWQPFQSLVFDRWTLAEKEKVYRQIAGMEMRVLPA